MASWSTPTTYVAGDALAVSSWNVVANNETFLYQAPYANYYNSVATSIPSGAVTQVTLGGTTFSGYGFSVSSNNAVAPLTGIYWAAGSVRIDSTSSFTQVLIYQNGGPKAAAAVPQTIAGETANVTTTLKCTAADTVALYASQNSGGALNTAATAAQVFLTLAFVGSQ